eukprot:GABV01004968.1.p1 GENE.GABV01004968.1~~GABV01004968.1.p1  ORF type:complete len:142 (+),score=3.61 GABV01004968.1:56-427(+)
MLKTKDSKNGRPITSWLLAAHGSPLSVLRSRRHSTTLLSTSSAFWTSARTEGIQKALDDFTVNIEKELLPDSLLDAETFNSLPAQGVPEDRLMQMLNNWMRNEDSRWDTGKVSGQVYFGAKNA